MLTLKDLLKKFKLKMHLLPNQKVKKYKNTLILDSYNYFDILNCYFFLFILTALCKKCFFTIQLIYSDHSYIKTQCLNLIISYKLYQCCKILFFLVYINIHNNINYCIIFDVYN